MQPPKYAMNAAMGTLSAVKRKVEKSAISKTNNAADHSKFGRYNTKVLHAIGNTHAIATKSNKTPNTALISGTNKILSSNDQPETYPNAPSKIGVVAICADKLTEKADAIQRAILPSTESGNVSPSSHIFFWSSVNLRGKIFRKPFPHSSHTCPIRLDKNAIPKQAAKES